MYLSIFFVCVCAHVHPRRCDDYWWCTLQHARRRIASSARDTLALWKLDVTSRAGVSHSQSKLQTQWAPRKSTTDLTSQKLSEYCFVVQVTSAKDCCWIQRLWLDEFNLLVLLPAFEQYKYNIFLPCHTATSCSTTFKSAFGHWTHLFSKLPNPCKSRQ